MTDKTKENLRRRLRAAEGKIAHLETQIAAAYDGRNKLLEEKVIAPAIAKEQKSIQEMVVAAIKDMNTAHDELKASVAELQKNLAK